MIKDLIIAISLANLCMMKVWSSVNYTYSMSTQYHSQLSPNMIYYFAAILNVLLLAAFFWVAMTLARRSKNKKIIKVAKVVFIVTLIIPVYIFMSTVSKTLSIVFAIALLILLLRMFYYFHSDITNILTKGVLIFFAFFLINLSQTAFTFLKLDTSEFKDKSLAEAITVREQGSNRVLWLIFDEMDQRLAFEDRPAGVFLPELDSFRNKALYSSNAYPPAGETDLSLPSLITGKTVSEVETIRPNELLIKTSDENQIVGWSTVPNVFSKAYDMGINTALIGWYHPYRRIIGGSLTSCSWNPGELTEITFSEAMFIQFGFLIKSIPLTEYCDYLERFYVLDKLKQKYYIESYLELLNDSIKAAVNNDLGLILVHLPVPHPPGYYDRVRKDFSLKGCSYLDNLALADQTLGKLRHTMENSDMWDNTTVIVTSDHWLRRNNWDQKKLWVNESNSTSFYKGNDYRIPFMIKLAGQKEGLNYDQAFNTVLTHDLIIAILDNEISNPEDVVKWIDNNRLAWVIPDYNISQNINSLQNH